LNQNLIFMKHHFAMLALAFAFFIIKCTPATPPETGETLAKINCASCHAYPEPGLLDRQTWQKYVLPRMGVMLGVLPADSAGAKFIEPAIRQLALKNPSVFRETAAISKAEWAAIRDFYLENAPEKMKLPPALPINPSLPFFKIKFPDYYLSPPSTTLVKISNGSLFLGDANSKRLYRFDRQLVLEQSTPTGEGAVWINQIPEGAIVTSMGSFSPTDMPLGKVLFLPKNGNNPVLLIDSLQRPVHTEAADLDGDGRFDLLVSEFAKWTGGLSWWKNDGRGNFERHLLHNMPGAIRTQVQDLNGDGLPDIVALFGQGDEGIFIFYNRGNGQFEEERALRFPPSYGSSFFSLFDFNGDGHPDILYTCGDNADYLPVLKPYHGIRIFQNDGHNRFEEVFFYALPGAYGAVAADFDLDGDLDLAAISFFPDFEKKPANSFVFLENMGAMQLEASTFPAAGKGRWIVMDAGDLDGDGDADLALGSLAFEVIPPNGLPEQWVKDGIPFVVLENLTR
jgi:hypothetical protein